MTVPPKSERCAHWELRETEIEYVLWQKQQNAGVRVQMEQYTEEIAFWYITILSRFICEYIHVAQIFLFLLLLCFLILA